MDFGVQKRNQIRVRRKTINEFRNSTVLSAKHLIARNSFCVNMVALVIKTLMAALSG